MRKINNNINIILNIVISLLQAAFLSVYVNLLSNKIITEKSLLNSIKSLKFYNFYIVIAVVFLILQIFIALRGIRANDNQKKVIINNLLKVACISISFPKENIKLRAIVTICDYNNEIRKTAYSYNVEASPERTATYDLFFGITGEAIKLRRVICKELPENHISTYDENNRIYVEPDLKSVLAAPIYSNKETDKIIGVLAFDSVVSLKTLKLDSNYSKKVAQLWADIISDYL